MTDLDLRVSRLRQALQGGAPSPAGIAQMLEIAKYRGGGTLLECAEVVSTVDKIISVLDEMQTVWDAAWCVADTTS